jgi:hypothetical protein
VCLCVQVVFILAESPRVIFFESKIDLMLWFIHMLTRLDARRTQEDQYIILSQSNERMGTARWSKISSTELLWQKAEQAKRRGVWNEVSTIFVPLGPRFWNDIKGGGNSFFILTFLFSIQLSSLHFISSLSFDILCLFHTTLITYSTAFLQLPTTSNNERLTMVHYLR